MGGTKGKVIIMAMKKDKQQAKTLEVFEKYLRDNDSELLDFCNFKQDANYLLQTDIEDMSRYAVGMGGTKATVTPLNQYDKYLDIDKDDDEIFDHDNFVENLERSPFFFQTWIEYVLSLGILKGINIALQSDVKP